MNNIISDFHTKSALQTIEIAENFIKNLDDKNCLIILSGDLGAGKTYFTKGLFKGLGYKNFNEITSPTFDLVNSYQVDKLLVHHFDLYRIDSLTQEDSLWLQEFLNEDSLCIIEWGDKFNYLVNKKKFLIKISFINENERQIKIFTN
jgi:tRNA threonylcarbamoyladenosine biosynthesis protein TsaE